MSIRVTVLELAGRTDARSDNYIVTLEVVATPANALGTDQEAEATERGEFAVSITTSLLASTPWKRLSQTDLNKQAFCFLRERLRSQGLPGPGLRHYRITTYSEAGRFREPPYEIQHVNVYAPFHVDAVIGFHS